MKNTLNSELRVLFYELCTVEVIKSCLCSVFFSPYIHSEWTQASKVPCERQTSNLERNLEHWMHQYRGGVTSNWLVIASHKLWIFFNNGKQACRFQFSAREFVSWQASGVLSCTRKGIKIKKREGGIVCSVKHFHRVTHWWRCVSQKPLKNNWSMSSKEGWSI